jgi:hypothetical protein
LVLARVSAIRGELLVANHSFDVRAIPVLGSFGAAQTQKILVAPSVDDVRRSDRCR